MLVVFYACWLWKMDMFLATALIVFSDSTVTLGDLYFWAPLLALCFAVMDSGRSAHRSVFEAGTRPQLFKLREASLYGRAP